MNNINANTNTDEEIKYLTLDDLDKMWEEAKSGDCGFLWNQSEESSSRGISLQLGDSITAKMYIRDLPADHAKLLLDFYNLFDENEPYKDKSGPYRDKLLNDLYFNIYERDYGSPNGKGILEVDTARTTSEVVYSGKTAITINTTNVGTRKIQVLDKNQKIEKLKKSFDIFKRLKERDLVLASIYDRMIRNGRYGEKTYSDYYGDENTHIILLNERQLLGYIKHFFSKANIRAVIFIREKFPNVEVTENMMAQYLEYKGR